MNFLVFANLWLLTRLVSLFRDDAVDGRVWRIKAGIELIALAVLYPCGGVWLAAAAAVVALNILGYRLERRAGRKDFARLALGLLGLVAWSICFSPRLGLAFRPELGEWSGRLGHWTVLTPLLQVLGGVRFQLVLFGLLLSANEANLVIRAVFDWLDLKPRFLSARPDGSTIDIGEFNRGRVIGILERVLLYSFVLQAQYGAIGFILAAKAFTRFKALDDRPFAEYVLIGTLLSACLALATGGLVHWLLRH
ncbi:hypothetical protein [Opitutus sp. GAS368]|jgi:hypothetical protein|uniref:hypothetical protein n=1 Tax=Opitutus sp. GAS368 TaxID=1882749 RepID=UPI00087A881C|nr:hypothetical protein [Opitutus sp. GAS368]SDR65268.1 hypothetical protein SAMN05444173_0019 [Opitutus sp. GAS368]